MSMIASLNELRGIALQGFYQTQFRQYWQQFSAQINLEYLQSEALYLVLYRAYTEPQRHYHTVQHIVECLALFDQIKDELDDTVAVQVAIWFHDAVYDPKASDNELQSAELMQKYCSHFLDQAQLEKIYMWILATQQHQATADPDLNTVLDIDLAILGRDSTRFAEYQQQIQQEYAWVKPEIYQLKRAAVLQHFYNMQPLYQTEYFQHNLEHRAKENLKACL